MGWLDLKVGGDGLKSVEKAKRLLRDFGDEINPVIARALNRALEGVPTDAAKAVSASYGVKSSEVRQAVRVRRADPQKLNGTVTVSGPVLGLYKFGARPSKPTTNTRDNVSGRIKARDGVSVNVRERARLPNAFIATMQSGHTGVFARKDDGGIYELFGPSVAHMVETLMQEEPALFDAGFDERFNRRLDHELQRYLKKQG